METIRQTVEWQVDDERFSLTGGPDRWTLTHPDGTAVELGSAGLTALAEAIVRIGLAPATGRRARRHERAGLPWTDDEDAELEQQHAARLSRREMARLHGRSVSAITARLVHLGLEQATDPFPSGRRRAVSPLP